MIVNEKEIMPIFIPKLSSYLQKGIINIKEISLEKNINAYYN